MSSWKHVPASGGLPPYRLFTGDLEKPSLDARQYRMIELQNGVRAVLVHDPEADKSAACLSVAVGHMYDPVCRRPISCHSVTTSLTSPDRMMLRAWRTSVST